MKRLRLIKNEISQLHLLRTKLGITQEELADEVGVSQPYIARIESGNVDPKLSTIIGMREALSKRSSKCCGDIMTDNPVTIGPRDPVSMAVALMRRRTFSQLPVVRGGQTIGLITESDIIRNLSLDLNEVNVEAIMSPLGVPAVDESTPVESILSLMNSYQAIVVEKQGRIQGIITRSDLIRRVK